MSAPPTPDELEARAREIDPGAFDFEGRPLKVERLLSDRRIAAYRQARRELERCIQVHPGG